MDTAHSGMLTGGSGWAGKQEPCHVGRPGSGGAATPSGQPSCTADTQSDWREPGEGSCADEASVRHEGGEGASDAASNASGSMGVREAKARLGLLAGSTLGAFLTAYTYAEQLMYLLTRPFQSVDPQFIFTGMNEALAATTQVCTVAALLAVAPLAAYNYWAFFAPSCFQHERAAFTRRCAKWLSLVYCATGLAYLVLPRMLDFMLYSSAPFMGAEGEPSTVKFSARIDSYVQLAFRLMLIPPAVLWAATTKVSLLKGGCVLLMFGGSFALAFEATVLYNMMKTVMSRMR